MLDQQNIRGLVNNLCFDLDCNHFNSEYSTVANPTNLRNWLSNIVEQYDDVLRSDAIGDENRAETDWGEAHLTYEKLVAEIEAFDKKPVPTLTRNEIKDVYIGLVSGTLHPRVLLLSEGGFVLEDDEFVDYISDDFDIKSFKEVTLPARSRGFIEDIIMKYKPETAAELYQLFDTYPNGMKADSVTAI